ncbi:unnamed protein product [Gordionus sp. m RMFG-2023]
MYGRKAIQAYGDDEENDIDPDNVEEIDRENYFQIGIDKSNVELISASGKQVKTRPNICNIKHYVTRKDDTIKAGQKKFPRSSEKFHSSTIKDDDENFQEPAIKNLKLNAEENHMKVMNILNSIVGEDYNYDGVKTPEKASKMLEPDDIRPFGAPPSNLKIVDGEVDKLNRNDDEIILETVVSKKDVKNLFIPTNRNWKIYHSLRYNRDIKKRYPKFKNGIMSENFSTERIIGDGNCLFRCISKEICEDECHYHFLRSECVRFMKNLAVVHNILHSSPSKNSNHLPKYCQPNLSRKK